MAFARTVMRWILALFFVGAGTMHVVEPQVYLPMMPPYLPAHMPLILISGIAEVLGGVGLLIARTRTLAAWGLVALLIAVWPANLHIALHDVPLFGNERGFGAGNWVRVALQVPLIAWAGWFTREPPETDRPDRTPA